MRKKVVGHIIDDLDNSSGDSDRSDKEQNEDNVFRENNFQKFAFFQGVILNMNSGCLSSQ